MSPKSYSNVPSVSVGHDDGSTATRRTSASVDERQRDAAEVRAAAARRDHDVGPRLAGQRELLLGLEADDRLVQEHVVEHRAERVVGVVAADRVARRRREIASPSEPGLDGSSTGDGTTSPPHVSITIRRYGFCS